MKKYTNLLRLVILSGLLGELVFTVCKAIAFFEHFFAFIFYVKEMKYEYHKIRKNEWGSVPLVLLSHTN
jgi:hypothetical protein